MDFQYKQIKLTQERRCMADQLSGIIAFYNAAPKPHMDHIILPYKLRRDVAECIKYAKRDVVRQNRLVRKLAAG